MSDDADSQPQKEFLRQTIEMFEVITQSMPQDYQSLEILKEAYVRLNRQKDAIKTSKRIANAFLLHGRCHELGRSFEPGDKVVVKDEIEAYAWFCLAANADQTLSNDRDRLAKGMSPQQIAAGQKRSNELRAQIEEERKSGDK